MSKKCYLVSFVHMQEYHFLHRICNPRADDAAICYTQQLARCQRLHPPPHSSTILFLLCRCCTIGVEHQRHCLLRCLVWEWGGRVGLVGV